MFALTFTNDTVCTAARVLALMHPHDPEGEKTMYYVQIDGVKRKISPKDVKAMNRDWT